MVTTWIRPLNVRVPYAMVEGMAGDEELWNTERVMVFLGARSIRSAMGTINRLGLEPFDREPGRTGMNRYRAAEVIEKVNAMPGRGKRTDLGAAGANPGADLHPDASRSIASELRGIGQ